MDQTALPRAKIYPEDELSNHTNSEYVPSALFLPRTRKPKKDALRQKKRNKALEKKLAATDYQEADNASTKQKSDEDHPSQGNSAKVSSQPPQVGSQNCSQNLLSLVTKPPYLSINKKNCIFGDYGHSTAFFRRPLIQGTYFLEFTVKEDGYKYKQVKFDSAVRVGICEANFNPVFPLGYKQSIGYKSIDGSIIYQNQKIGSAEPYKAGDTIAVCLKLGSLQKFRKPQAKNEEACLSFYKNGRLMFQFRETKQLFYCFGLSCYNYSQIQIKTEQECSYIPQGSHYFKCLKQKILYKDLEHNKMFKI